MKEAGKMTDKKEDVFNSAVKLFNMYGYHGTSVRAISEEAGVNIALISYYFGGKKGLLEALITAFYEDYIKMMEKAVAPSILNTGSPLQQIRNLAAEMLAYQQERFYLSRLVHRELTIDSVLIREVMSTYLMKEKYMLEYVFKKGIASGEIRPLPLFMLVMHFRELMLLPFLQPQYIRYVYFIQPSQPAFRETYLHYIDEWLFQIKRNSPVEKGMAISLKKGQLSAAGQ